MADNLKDLLPAPDELLRLTPEGAGRRLLSYLAYLAPSSPHLHRDNLLNPAELSSYAGAKAQEVGRVLAEALSWLEANGFVASEPGQQLRVFVTRLGSSAAQKEVSSGGATPEGERPGAADEAVHVERPPDGDAAVGESVLPACSDDLPTSVDLLGFTPYVSAIVRFLTDPGTRPPLTLSIEGEWGSGKSSLMKQLQEALNALDPSQPPSGWWKSMLRRCMGAFRSEPRPTVWFDAWTHDKDEALWAAFALEFLRQMPSRLSLWRRCWGHFRLFTLRFSWKEGWLDLALAASVWLCFVGAIGLVVATSAHLISGGTFLDEWVLRWTGLDPLYQKLVGLGGGGGGLAALLSAWKKLRPVVGNPLKVNLRKYLRSPDYEGRVSFIEQFHADFAKVVTAYASDRTVFVFIDDLDRCEIPKAADLMQALNLLVARAPRLVFILAGC